MKRLIIALLIAVMILTAGAFALEELPDPGEVVSGFKVKSVTPMDVIGATGVLFEHEKSGAQLLYLANEDTNRSFDITFRTPALDDKGKPHIFEHITIAGSRKYPDANMFFPFDNQTYSTFVNALTASSLTTFPVASLSQDQLFTMMDYYLSGVFTPLLYDDARLFEREAWRYELTDADAPLNITGTVYSEMQGARTIQRQAAENDRKTLFKDGPTAYVSGGVPEAIKTLSYDELIAFHDSYYHPSNALIVLYGDLEYTRFLEFIDSEYLSKYDKKDVKVEMGKIEPYAETLYQSFDAPVEVGAQTEKASYIYYSFGTADAGLEDTLGLTVLSGYLNSEASPVMKTVRERLPGASVSVNVDFDSPVPKIAFVATGVDESDRDTFVKAIDDAIAEIVENGIPEDDLDSVVSLNKISLMLTPEDSNLGVDSSINIALCWTYFDSVEFYNTYENVVNTIDVQKAQELVSKYLSGNTYRAVSVTRPVAGLAEQNAEKLAQELAQIKESMSDDEIASLVAKSNEFIAWGQAGADPEIIKPLLNVTVDNLPEEIKHYDVHDEVKDGARYLTSDADVSGIARISIMLDGSTIPADMLPDVQVYLSLLGQLDTEKYAKEELSTLMTRYLSGFGASLSSNMNYAGNDSLYTANLNWIGLTEDADMAVELLGEVFLDTKLDDTTSIVDALTRMNAATRDSFDSQALNIQMLRCMAALYPENAYMASASGIDLYRHIEMLIADPEGIAARLEKARDFIANKHDAIVACAGDSSANEAYASAIGAFLSMLSDVEREKVDYSSLVYDFKGEIVVNNSSVHMNMVVGKTHDYTGKNAPLKAFIDDMYMLPRLRNALGAYGGYATLAQFNTSLYSYRDPNLKGSFDIFAELPEYMRTVEITQEDVDRYIIGSYTALSRPQGEITGALNAIIYKLVDQTEQRRLNILAQAKSTTVQDVRDAAERIEKLLEDGVRSTSGSLGSIGDDIAMFDTVTKLEASAPEAEAAA